MWEMHECMTNAGQTKSTYGVGFNMWTAQGFADWLIGNWISVSV